MRKLSYQFLDGVLSAEFSAAISSMEESATLIDIICSTFDDMNTYYAPIQFSIARGLKEERINTLIEKVTFQICFQFLHPVCCTH